MFSSFLIGLYYRNLYFSQSKFRLSYSKPTLWILLTRQPWWGFRSPCPRLLHIFQICSLAPIINSRSVIVPITKKSKIFLQKIPFHFPLILSNRLIFMNTFFQKVIMEWQDQRKKKNFGTNIRSCSGSQTRTMKSQLKMQNPQISRLQHMSVSRL